MAANAPDELKSLLKDVQLYGTVTVNKRKLLWLLGWGQDRPDTWRDLLRYWDEISPSKDDLFGFQIYDSVVLTVAIKSSITPIKNWSKGVPRE